VIHKDQIEEVRSRADIVQIINGILPLKKSGKDYKACCPFHEEKTPSFYVVPAKGFYKCFGCGESGDVFSFLQHLQGLEFTEAVKQVAQSVGMEIKEDTRLDGEIDPFAHLYQVNSFALKYFKDSLWNEELGKQARDYLEHRKISKEMCDRYSVGFAPNGWNGLREAALNHGMNDGNLLEAGLLSKSERREEPFDRFRGRITFAIEGTSGKVLGFGGRLLDIPGQRGAKYLNSPETPIYQKGSILYGLGLAKNSIRREQVALIVEGYLDVISLAQNGFENVVAALGTGFTKEQAELLGRYTPKACLLFDSDKAGLKATFRSADVLLASGVHPSISSLPPGTDPDGVVHEEGADALATYIDGSVDVLDRKLQVLNELDYFSDIEKTRMSIDRLLPTIRAAQDPALQDIYVSKVAEYTGVKRETLESELSKIDAKTSGSVRQLNPQKHKYRSRPLSVPSMGAEKELLLLLVKDVDMIERTSERIGPDDFTDPNYRAIFKLLLEQSDFTEILGRLDPSASSVFQKILSNSRELTETVREKIFVDLVNRMLSSKMQRKMDHIDELIRGNEDERTLTELLTEKTYLGRERRELGLDWSAVARKTFK
jgi:DNA primase